MKVYVGSFTGHWPVGTAAVIVADDKTEAIKILEDKLAEIGLPQRVFRGQLTEIDMNVQEAHILCDGNY